MERGDPSRHGDGRGCRFRRATNGGHRPRRRSSTRSTASSGATPRSTWRPDAPRGASRCAAAAAQAAYTALAGLFPHRRTTFDARPGGRRSRLSPPTPAEDHSTVDCAWQGLGRARGARDPRVARRPTALNPPVAAVHGQQRSRRVAAHAAALCADGRRRTWGRSPSRSSSSRRSAFRPLDGPPSLTSAEYTDNFNEVKDVGGQDTSTTRTDDQTGSARFWASTAGSVLEYQSAVERVAGERTSTLSDNARLFALLNVARRRRRSSSCWDAEARTSTSGGRSPRFGWRTRTAIPGRRRFRPGLPLHRDAAVSGLRFGPPERQPVVGDGADRVPRRQLCRLKASTRRSG